MPGTTEGGSRNTSRRYVRKKLSSADASNARYVLEERQAVNEWACVPKSRRRIDILDEPEPRVSETKRSRCVREMRQDYDHGDYYESDIDPDDDYEADVPRRRARLLRFSWWDLVGAINFRPLVTPVLVILAAIAAGMAVESQFGLIGPVVVALTATATALIEWFGQANLTTLVGGGAVLLIALWMAAKAMRLNGSRYEAPTRRRTMVSKETLDRYF
ncbi:MAG: hypothetical protein C4575_03640 [Desulforudis sp.]|jgi:hypothetical protein|nr:MAG: hypothetical protein C4575_03640 [Desulforudis sp.]